MSLKNFLKQFEHHGVSRRDAADILEGLAQGRGDKSLLCLLEYMGDDPLLQDVCRRLNEIERNFPPPLGSKAYCSEVGIKLIRELIGELRAANDLSTN